MKPCSCFGETAWFFRCFDRVPMRPGKSTPRCAPGRGNITRCVPTASPGRSAWTIADTDRRTSLHQKPRLKSNSQGKSWRNLHQGKSRWSFKKNRPSLWASDYYKLRCIFMTQTASNYQAERALPQMRRNAVHHTGRVCSGPH